jgi:hypothetical protein
MKLLIMQFPPISRQARQFLTKVVVVSKVHILSYADALNLSLSLFLILKAKNSI